MSISFIDSYANLCQLFSVRRPKCQSSGGAAIAFHPERAKATICDHVRLTVLIAM